ncbi:MAG TPA: MarR family transcriptional regulator [Candidatus Aphodovivens excrementavium]|nr:MarR family transcriptional regulator [Candidatus Aphodovivens excrementavium]
MAFEKTDDLITLFHKVNKVIGGTSAQNGRQRPGQIRILGMLSEAENGEMDQRELLKNLPVKAGSLSEILRKLERNGCIERRRNEDDKRGIIVTITESGRVLYRESEVFKADLEDRLFGSFPAEKREQLVSLLSELLEEWRQDPSMSAQQERGACWDMQRHRHR